MKEHKTLVELEAEYKAIQALREHVNGLYETADQALRAGYAKERKS